MNEQESSGPTSSDALLRARLSECSALLTDAWPITKITVATNLADVESLWRSAEEEMISSPYQTFGWYSAWLATVGAREHCEPVIIVAYDEHDEPIAILPLVKRRLWNGLVLCEFAGGRHSNANFGMFSTSFRSVVTAKAMRQILYKTSRLAGRVDTFSLGNTPTSWHGHNVWISGIGGQPSPSFLHATPIDQPFEQWEAAWLSPSRRKKLRQQRTHFKRMGPIRLVEGASRKEVERILAAFYEQKSRRFAELGFDDPFADPPIRDFLCAAARAGLNKQSSPTMALFALEVDGIIASTLGAAVIGKTCSAMFLSHDDSLPFRAASPGGFLVAEVIRRLCERGFTHFDLGIGEASYKDRYCARVIPLRHSYLGITYRGILLAGVLQALTFAKRVLKKVGFAKAISVTTFRLRRLFSFR